MEKKEYVRPRNINLAFRVTKEERDMIERRMAQRLEGASYGADRHQEYARVYC